MVTIYARFDGSQGHYQFKCDYGDKYLRFFNVTNVSPERVREQDAYYCRTDYTYLCEVESLEDFIQEQKLLNLLEE